MLERSPTTMTRLSRLADFRFQLRKFLSFSETACDNAGISVQQYQLMQVIATIKEGKGSSISDLAERMFLRHNSAVELVDRAVRAGLVRRESDQADLRRSLVVMTDEGSALLVRLVGEHLAEVDLRGHEMMHAMELLLASGRQGKEK